jgi:hypothetical protein
MRFILKILVLAFLIAASKFNKDQQIALQKQAKAPSAGFNQSAQQASLAPVRKPVAEPSRFTSRAVMELN